MTKKKLHIEDLNDDPSLLDSASDEEIVALAKEANNPDISLGGNIRSDLIRRASDIAANKA